MDMAWQCKCGNVEYNSMEPEECLECGKLGSFTQLPAELIEERQKDLESYDDLSDEEMSPIKLSKPIKSKVAKVAKKAKKPTRRKK